MVVFCGAERFLSSYQTLDESLAVIMAKISEKSNKTPGKTFMTAMTSKSRDDMTTIAIPKRETTHCAIFCRHSTETLACTQYLVIMYQQWQCVQLFRSTLLSRPNKVGCKCPSVRSFVRSSTKVSSISMKFGMYVEIDE